MRRIVDAILLRFIDKQFHEEFVGDLEEIYEERVAAKGKLLAEVMYCFDAIHLLIGFFFHIAKTKKHNPSFYGKYV